MAKQYEYVRISNFSFMIANSIRVCPAHTVIRELLQNAIENVLGVSPPGKIEWFREKWNGIEKIGLYNEGPGMSAAELYELMQIASSGKNLGMDKNFGQGAKLSAGKASPYGYLVRSCKNGIVSECWLQLIDEADGGKNLVMVAQYDDYEERVEIVRQVTDDAQDRGRSLDRDWTEALLLGRSHDDPTVTGEFLGKSSPTWLMESIVRRYYRFPAGIKIRSAHVTSHNPDDQHRNARGLQEVLTDPAYTEQQELVAIRHDIYGPMTLCYGRLVGKSSTHRGGPWLKAGIGGGSHVCLVYKDEIYDFDSQWGYRAGAYGFSGINENYYLHAVLADDAPVGNNLDRTEIEAQGLEAKALRCEDFASLFRKHRPAWVLADLQARLENRNDADLHKKILKLAEKAKAMVEQARVKPEPGGDVGIEELGGRFGPTPPEPPDPPQPRPKPKPGPAPLDNGPLTRQQVGKKLNRPRLDSLQVRFRGLDSDNWYREMVGQAGHYDSGDNTIWLSFHFSEYQRLKDWIDEEWPQEEEHTLALARLDEVYRYQAAKFGISALCFRGQENWSPEQWNQCLTHEALSCCLRDPDGEMETKIRADMARRLNLGIRREHEKEGVPSDAQ